MKLSLRLLIPTLAIVLTAGAAALLFSSPIQAQESDTTAPTVESVDFTSDGPYTVGSTIDVTVTFSEMVVAVAPDSPGDATIGISLHHDPVQDPATTTRTLTATNPIEATLTLTFSYVVLATDGEGSVNVEPNTLILGGSGLEDTAASPNFLSDANHAEVVGGMEHRVDKTAPTLDGVNVNVSDIDKIGGTITATVTFSEAMKTPTSTPTLSLQVGGQERTAGHSGRADENKALLFTYTTQKDDSGDVTAPAGSISPNGGTITDLAGNPAVSLSYTDDQVTVGEHTVAIDTAAPEVKYKAPSTMTVGVRIRTIRPQTTETDITYALKEGSRLPRTLRFNDETGEITGRPTRATAGPTRLTIVVCDKVVDAAGDPVANCADVPLNLPAILEAEEDVVAADTEATLPDVADPDLSNIPVGDAAPSTALQLALAATGGALLLGGAGMVAVRRQRVRTRR